MQSPYHIAKTVGRPSQIAPDTIYLASVGNALEIYVSNSTGSALASPVSKADLVNGRVPSTQLPPFIDARIDLGAFPSIGLENILYIDLTVGSSYIWNAGEYQRIGSSSSTTTTSTTVVITPTGSLQSTDLQSALTELDTKKADRVSPTFTGTVSGITKAMVGLDSVDNTSDAAKPISIAAQAMFSDIIQTKAPLASPTFTGTVSGINATMVGLGAVSNTSDAAKPISTATQSALSTKADISALPTKISLGLALVDNTSDATKPVSTAMQSALALKADISALPTKISLGLGSVDNTSDIAKPVSTAMTNALALKADLTALPTKVSLGLGSVDNTADLAKPVSNAVLASLALKADISALPTKVSLGLGSVDNTSDAAKPISAATQAALDAISQAKAAEFYATYSAFPVSGQTNVIYVDRATGMSYIWHDAAYHEMNHYGSTATDITFDPATTGFVGTNVQAVVKEISTSLATKVALVNGVAPTGIAPYANAAGFPVTGDVTHLYIDGSTDAIYIWNGSAYVHIGGSSGSTPTVTAGEIVSSPTGSIGSANVQSALQELDTEKAPLNNPVFTGTVSGITKGMVGLGYVDNTPDASKPISSAVQAALNVKATLVSPTFTGTVSGITRAMVGLGSVDNTSDLNKPVSTATQAALDLKATLIGGVVAPAQLPSYVSDVIPVATLASFPAVGLADKIYIASDTNLTYRWAGSTYVAVGMAAGDIHASTVQYVPGGSISAINTQAAIQSLDTSKAPLASPVFTGTVTGITATMVGLDAVDNTSDAGKPISTLTAAALLLKAPLDSPAFTGTVTGISKASVGLSAVDNTSDAGKPVSSATQIALNAKAPLVSPTFTGTVSGINATMVGLGAVNNTSDAAKPVSTATQSALDAKAPLVSPAFTGTVTGITATMVGLGNVNNTSDAAKPVSTATQSALDAKAPLASPAFTGTVTGITATMVGLGAVNNTSDAAKPISTATQSALDLKAPLASPTFSGTISDTLGKIRSIPKSANTGNLVAADNGLHRQITAGMTIDTSAAFAIGDSCVIYNTTSAALVLTSSGVTLYQSGTDTVKASLSLAARGLCTVFCTAANVYVLSGDLI